MAVRVDGALGHAHDAAQRVVWLLRRHESSGTI
jgi:hypothetical protein